MWVSDNPRVIARWLRQCSENSNVADRCHSCPFGRFADLEDANCMDELHLAAAELIEKQNKIPKEEIRK